MGSLTAVQRRIGLCRDTTRAPTKPDGGVSSSRPARLFLAAGLDFFHRSVSLSPMKILSALFLALALFTGCATRPDVDLKVEVVRLNGGRQFEFFNASGQDLHDVKIKGAVSALGEWVWVTIINEDEWKRSTDLKSGEVMIPVDLLRVKGTCKEGRIYGVWAYGDGNRPGSVSNPQTHWTDETPAPPDPNREDLKLPDGFRHWWK